MFPNPNEQQLERQVYPVITVGLHSEDVNNYTDGKRNIQGHPTGGLHRSCCSLTIPDVKQNTS